MKIWEQWGNSSAKIEVDGGEGGKNTNLTILQNIPML